MDDGFFDRAAAKGIVSEDQANALKSFWEDDFAAHREREGFGFNLSTIVWLLGAAAFLFGGFLSLFLWLGDPGQAPEAWLSAMILAALASVYLSRWLLRQGSWRGLSVLALFAAAVAASFGAAIWQFELQTIVEPRPFSRGYELVRQGDDYVRVSLSFLWPLDAAAFWLAPFAAFGIWAVRARGFLPGWVALAPALFFIAFELLLRGGPGAGMDELDLLTDLAVVGGLGAWAAGWWADVKLRANHGFWLNKLGMLAFSFGMAEFFVRASELGKDLFLLIALIVIFSALFQRRQATATFGIIGIGTWAIDWLAQYEISIGVGLSVVMLGAVLVLSGMLLAIRRDWFAALMPPALERLRPRERTDPVTFGL